MALTLVSSSAIFFASGTTTATSAAIAVQVGDVLTCKVFTEDSGTVPGTPTSSGVTLSQSWRLDGSSGAVASTEYARIYTAIVSSAGNITVSCTSTGSGTYYRVALVNVWRGAALASTPAVNGTKTGLNGAPSSSITTTTAGSYVDAVKGDWNTVAGDTSATWRSGNVQEAEKLSSGAYEGAFFHVSAPTVGSYTLGQSAPPGQNWTIVGIEILAGSGSVAAAATLSGTSSLSATASATALPAATLAGVGSLTAAAVLGNPVSTLTADFAGTTIDTTTWANNYGTVSQSGVANVTAAASGTQAGFGSQRNYALRNSAAFVQVTPPAAGTSIYADAFLTVYTNPGTYTSFARVGIATGSAPGAGNVSIWLWIRTLGTNDVVSADHIVAASAATWIQLRETSGTTYAEYSSDGITWSVASSFATPASAYAPGAEIDLEALREDGPTVAGAKAVFDNLNISTASAAATLAGTGSLTVAASATELPTATLAGVGSLTASGTLGRPATATLAGVGTLAAGASDVAQSVATLAGVGTLTASAVATPPPVAAYSFDESSGNALDQTGNGHTLALGSNLVRTTGHTGSGLTTVTSTSATSVSAATFGQTTDRTLMLWGKGTGSVWWVRWNVASIDSGAWGILLLGGSIGVQARNASTFVRATATAPSDGLWHHYAATYTESTGALTFYVDGVQAATTTLTGPLRTDADTVDLAEFGSDTTIDDLRVFTVALSASQIAAMAAMPVPNLLQPAAATLAGVGTLSAAASGTALPAATLSGAGSLTVAASATALPAATLAGTGTLTAAASATALPAATLSGTGTLVAAASAVVLPVATLAGAGTLTADTSAATFPLASLTGVGTLAANGNVGVTVSMAGVGTLTATPSAITTGAAATLSGAGSMSAGLALAQVAAAVLTGTGALSATPSLARAAAANLVGVATLGAAALLAQGAAAGLSGVATLTAGAYGIGPMTALLQGAGSLLASSERGTYVPYIPEGWTDNSLATPLSAARLNYMETGMVGIDNAQQGRAPLLVPTPLKVSAYTAAATDLVTVSVAGGAVAVTLPSSPVDKAQVGVVLVVAGGANAVTVLTGGTDVMYRTGGPTSYAMVVQGELVIWEYQLATGIWHTVAAGTPRAQLDTRYVQSLTAANATITVGGTAGAPTVAVGTIAESQVTNLVSDLSTLTTATASKVASVTAADATVTVAGTATAPTVKVGTIAESQVTNLVTDLAAKAPTASPTFTGTATAAALTATGIATLPRIAQAQTVLTFAATVTPDASAGSNFSLPATASFTLAGPSNPTVGQVLEVEITATAAVTVTLGTGIKATTATYTVASGKWAVMTLRYSGALSSWLVQSWNT